MTQIADDLVDISLIKQGKLRLHKRIIELGAVVERAIDSVDAAIYEQRTLEVTQPEQRVYLFADRSRIQQVITKLLLNASVHTNPHGRIRLDIALEDDKVVIGVEDDGAGIQPEHLPRLFDPYFRERREPCQPGLGLGLPLVRALVDMHGGTVLARSEGPGEGSRFEVRLPIASPQRLRALTFVH